jgi:hypothetical protein
MIAEVIISEGIRSDHRTSKLDREIRRLLQQEVLDDADRFNWFYLTSQQEDYDAYNGARF